MASKLKGDAPFSYAYEHYLDTVYRVAVHNALYLHYYEGYTAAEIGGILGAGRNTVLTWLARGRQALRERMIGGFDDDTI